jgi:4'-phosphopantetheinyl transferase
LRFNLSHSHQIALFAFGLDHDLGIDIKEIRPQVAFEGIEGRYFLPNERAELEALPRGLRPGGFLPSLDLQRSLCKGQGRRVESSTGKFQRFFDGRQTSGITKLGACTPLSQPQASSRRWSVRI